ncbi:hypothetical protein BDY19DRAFT_942504 [Irpex rosettiformis]|uniref:Uncharacterized protein n=1 Tax=Irpex rosettiformis TaxID=378272 RepID=A0ACB8U513_9APHY|nr:hypothetical protein BDY19DRAFT_942504 [Irpex rosettiformis]
MRQSRGSNDDTRGILRLPDDVLIDISIQFASFFRDTAGPLDSPDFWTRSVDYRWIIIAHICRRWREVVLMIPQLWTTIPLLSDTDRAVATLRRSGQLPLTVFEDISSFDLEGKRLVLKEIHRVAHLNIALNCQTLDCFIPLQRKNAPLLETLEFTYSDQDLYRRFDHDQFRQIFASWSFPSLTRLALHEDEHRKIHEQECLPEIGSIRLLLMPALIQLEIDTLASPIPVTTCIELLRALPLLEKLILGGVLGCPWGPVENPMPPSTARIVHLPHLRELNLRKTVVKPVDWIDRLYRVPFDFGVAAADLLNHLATPCLTSMHFTATCQRFSEDNLRFIFLAIRDKAVGERGNKLLPTFSTSTVNFFQGDNNTFNFLIKLENNPVSFLSTTQESSSSGHGRSLTVQVLLRVKNGDYICDANSKAFFDFGFPLSNISTLRWHTEQAEDVSEECWHSAFRAMPNLQDVEVTNSGRLFIRALRKATHTATGAPAGVLPNLTRLKIEDTDWCPHKSAVLFSFLQNLSFQSTNTITSAREAHWEFQPFIDQVIQAFSIRTPVLEELVVIAPMCFNDGSMARLESAGVAKSVKWINIPGLDCLL